LFGVGSGIAPIKAAMESGKYPWIHDTMFSCTKDELTHCRYLLCV
jgi:hypothetical protein